MIIIVFAPSNPVLDTTHLSISLPDCAVLDSWVSDNFIVPDELFVKVLQSLETCLSVNNNLSLDSPIGFNEIFNFTSVPLILV